MTVLQCQVRVRGHLSREWSEWFDGLAISYEEGDTLLAGPVADQSALYGLVIRLRDLGLALVSITTDPQGS